MRKALFTNGPGIGTLASAGVGCVALQMNFGTHARRALTQSRTEPKKRETTFSYDGWQMDAEFAEERDIEYPDNPEAMEAILDTMLRKQQVHNGDRSHPIIRKLDAVTPTLSYAGWEIDARKIEWPEAKSPESQYERTQLRVIVLSRIGGGVGMRERDVDFALERMRTKQIQHEIATESSDAKQRRLNDIVNRGLKREQMCAALDTCAWVSVAVGAAAWPTALFVGGRYAWLGVALPLGVNWLFWATGSGAVWSEFLI